MKHNKKTIKLNRVTNRFISVFLSLCMTASMVSGTAFAAVPGPTEKIVDGTRVADPNTMDDYQNKLLTMENGSRYAGRVWTDKSVFAYDKNGENKITLDMATDGYNGSVGYNADFAHTFSALASSQVVNEYPPSPIDLVIVFDMSGSMGQDTRYDIDSGVNSYVKANDSDFPQDGVPMDERIKNSRIQKTLDAINETIDGLMAQNPQNRVAVCGYGANAVVIMPLAHYKKVDDKPYLSVGGMETLYYPGDLKLDNDGVWKWQNNRDTCYTVVANAEMNTYTGPLDDNTSKAKEWTEHDFTVSNNINSDGVKAFPGVAKQEGNWLEESKKFQTSSNDIANSKWKHGESDNLKNAMKDTKHLTADDYVGYFTNTQGGIYLAYKQLADSTVTTYSETLSTGVMSTVARIPATIIMSDGGANFAFNEMGNDQQDYTVDDWNNRYAAKHGKSPIDDPNGNLDEWYMNDNNWDGSGNDGHNKDYSHRLGNPSSNVGDEWYNVYLPGDDTLKPGTKETTDDGKWDGLHGIYNTGADFYQEGTLSTAPSCYSAGVLYNSDNDPAGTGGTVMEVLLTASYMNTVVKEHYQHGWDKNKATASSRIDLSTYTMNVDTKHVPQWGRWRLYPTLDPKEYALDDIGKSDSTGWGSTNWNNTKDSKLGDTYGGSDWGKNSVYISAGAFTGLKNSWDKWKSGEETDFSMGNGIRINLSRLDSDGNEYNAGGDDTVNVTNDDVINNIAYNERFYDVDSEKLGEIFGEILDIILGKIFVPVSGDNDAGVGDSITYQDPIGEYMEVKNQSIKAKTHNDEEKGQDAQNYDMSLLLFGKMHGIVRTGIYDYQWNDKWMKAHKGTEQGEKAMPMGWYKGEDAASAEFSESLPSGCSTAEEAWGNGWVYRLDFKTFTSYVPIVDTPETPDELSQQAKNTKYTLYRFAGTAAERNELYINPIYGEKVPEAAQKAFDEKCEKDSEGNITSYPEGNGTYAEYDGVYRLSDIRIWLEDTGDFVDQEGAITPNSGYERSLYLNIPAAAVPTQLAEITLGRDGVLSYETNLGSDHIGAKKDEDGNGTSYEEYCAQSTPFRLFYAVGLEEDLILRDSDGNQVGVDFNAISAEYISAHTVAGQDYVYFISNFYSNTTYNDYVTDTATARTRGDPTVTFSPSSDNRYYVFQKPLPLYAHAYRVEGESLKAVDRTDGKSWSKEDNQTGGNGKTTWETVGGAVQQPGSWTGGQFMGVYKSQDDFQQKLKEATASGGNTITDSHGSKYEVAENGVVFLEQDLMEHVTSDGSGYTKGSVSFSSDDYFFILVEYYLPDENSVGQDDKGNKVTGTYGGKMVQRVVSRRGSEFGSGFTSDQIDNGDMLCWTDMNGNISLNLEYFSRSTTGDNTRGEPTYEKLFLSDKDQLKEYLQNNCNVRDDLMVSAPTEEEPDREISALDQQLEYWLGVQENPQVKELIEQIKQEAETNEARQRELFEERFQFAVAARPGGIRSGDMSNNRHAKTDNKTSTANNYYVPTVSDDSGTDNNVILDTYLGNNGRLEIANQMLHVTKKLVSPEGFELSKEQQSKEFNYQIFVQGVSGTRTAVRTLYNEYSSTWERRLAYIDVLTDNSELLLDNNDNRALFDLGDGNTARLVVQGDNGLCYADDDGEPTAETCGKTENELYYLYLPSNNEAGEGSSTSVRRLYQDPEYNGEDKAEDAELNKNGRTTFFAEGQREETGSEPGAENRDSYRKATKDGTRPAGTRSYWALDTELIPVSEVKEAEGESNGMMADAIKLWNHNGAKDIEKNHQQLSYYTFIIRKPNDKTSLSDFSSPFKTRTMYMTTTLTFGVNANKNDGSAESGTLNDSDLYDQIVPSGDRPDLFGNLDNETIAKSTAEFTLKHGEGLLLTGLDNRITYRFTEKLSEEDIAAGYKLQEVSHIQQRGSDSIYRLGKQEIPVYTQKNATYGKLYPGVENRETENELTWAVDEDGSPNTEATETLEPFAHTNAVMWEYYATMADGTSGNHHQPSGATVKETESSSTVWTGKKNTYESDGSAHIVSDNPNCKICDEVQDDGSILHYMYREGKLIDPHYNGEASTYMRNMARYGVSPTVHFAVNDEPNTAIVPSTPNDDYTGVYSVFGNTGWFEEQVNYTNTYDVEPTEYAPQVKKTVIGNAPSDETFTFNIKESADNPSGAKLPTDTTATVKGAGSTSFGNITFSKVGTYKFEIREIAGESLGCTYDDSVWTLTVKVENVDSALAVTSHTYTKADGTTSSDNAEFENIYISPTEYAPKVTKTITGATTPNDKTFTFNITASEENPENGAILPEDKTATVTGAGTASFGNITFSKAGTYNFEIKETKGSEQGYTYDESVWTLTVVVVDNNLQLEVESHSYTKADGTTSNDGAEFTNTYSVEPTEFTPKVNKTVKGDTPSDKTFTFNITASSDNHDGAELPTDTSATVTGSGSTNFGNIKFTKAGTYNFEIKETKGSEQGYTYDESVWTLTVVVVDNESQLEVQSYNYSKADGTTSNDGAAFTNTYNVSPTEFTPKVNKTVKGDTPSDKTFTFNITASENNPSGAELPTDTSATVKGAGSASFGNITFSKAGTYNFEIKEEQGNEPGYSYDGSVWTLTVEVIDENSQLIVSNATYSKIGAQNSDEASFENSYSTTEVSYAPQVEKEITGDTTPSDKTFTFNIEASEDNPDGVEMPADTSATVTGSGSANFNAITFTKAGTYLFKISETKGNDAGYTYDESVWTLKVVVEDVDSALTIKSLTYEKEGGESSEERALFTNTYSVEPTEYVPQIEKTVTGNTPSDEDFTFNIRASADNPDGAEMPTDTSTTATGSGTASFDKITFSKAGTYTFEISEEKGNVFGYTYDESVWTLTVEVVDNESKLEVQSHTYTKADGTANEDKAEFENIYSSGSLTIGKVVTGDAGDKNKEFTFTVTFTDVNGNPLDGEYSYTGSKEGTIKSGEEVRLKDGESITISGLPIGTKYTVVEAEANKDGYTTTSKGESGEISEKEQKAEFTNSKNTEPTKPTNPTNPTEPTNPTDSTSPTSPTEPKKTTTTKRTPSNPPYSKSQNKKNTKGGNNGNTPNTGSESERNLPIAFLVTFLLGLNTVYFSFRRRKLKGRKVK